VPGPETRPRAELAAPSSRIGALDTLRGFGILCMLILHYPAFYNYFAPVRLNLAAPIPFEGAFFFKWTVFCPLVEQLFIALAAFNLARRSRAEFTRIYPAKLRQFAALFAGIYVVQFLAWSEYLGVALTFGPIQAWMLILGLIAVLYRYAGWKGVACAWAASGLAWVLPVAGWGDALQAWVTAEYGIGWEYDARPEYFLGSACLGFLVGQLHYHAGVPWRRQVELLAGVGAILFLPWLWAGDPLTSSRTALFASEHEVMRSPWGALGAWGQLCLCLAGALWAQARWPGREIAFLGWMGRWSLLIYAIHQVFWTRLLFPLHVFLAMQLETQVRSTDAIAFTEVALTLIACWMLTRSRVILEAWGKPGGSG
jgi:uncharacterized membrane protein